MLICIYAIRKNIKSDRRYRLDGRWATNIKSMTMRLLNGCAVLSACSMKNRRRVLSLSSRVGFTGNLAVFHHFKGIADFVDSYDSIGKKIILLLDMDRTGKYLTSRLVSQLQLSRHSVNLSYKRALARITNGKVRHVEDLVIYAPHMSGITGSRKDLYFYT